MSRWFLYPFQAANVHLRWIAATGNSQVARLSATPGYTPVHQNYEVIAAASKAQAYRSNRDSISFTTSLSFLTRKKVGNEVIKVTWLFVFPEWIFFSQ